MKLSIGFRGQAAFLTAGSGGRFGAMSAQWAWYSAPSAIQRVSVAFWAAVSVLPVFGGGIRRPLMGEVIRSIISLSSGLPGVIAPAFTASSRRSRRRSALRAVLSVP